jgi:predicted ATPase
LSDAFADGVWFVSLAPVSDPDLVPSVIAQVLGVTLVGDLPPIESVKRFLRDKRLLLVLDNFEHVVAAAPCVSELLTAAFRVHALVTSREALRLSGERLFEVPPMPGPSAVELFAQRAQAIQPAFVLTDENTPTVAAVCERLDGLPLAIELAAARSKLFEPRALLARLERRLALLTNGARDVAARHQTLRATIDWSYALLSADEQATFARMGVFAGGWTLEMAEEVGGVGQAVIAHLQSLIDKNLIKPISTAKTDGVETRFTMLETLREYALERLEERGEGEAVRQRHAAFFVEFVEHLPSPSPITSTARKARYVRLDVEQDNCRAALGWTLASGNAELGLRLAGALGDYWFWWANRWDEGWSWISQLLALPTAAAPKRARAHALRAALNLLHWRGEHTQANQLADESLALFRELNDKAGMAWVLVNKGWATREPSEQQSLVTESLVLFREIGDPRGIGMALWLLAGPEINQGRLVEAAALLEKGITAIQAAGDDALAGQLYADLGEVSYNCGDYARAAELQLQALALCREGGDADGANFVRVNLGIVSLAQGDIEGAASHLEASEAEYRRAQHWTRLAFVLPHVGYVRHRQGDAAAARMSLREALALQRQQQRDVFLVGSLERCAWIAADVHQPQRAAHLMGAAEAARERIGWPFPPGEKPLSDRHLAQVRAALNSEDFTAAWAEGRAMTLDQAIDYALTGL